MSGGNELCRVLYVEDEPDIRVVAQIALEQVGGLEICSCASGGEALARIVDFNPQLVLLDVMMPNMDGPTTLREIRKIASFAQTPVVFITAKVQKDEIDEFIELGASDVIAKPFNPITLADQVRVIWEAQGV